MVSLGLILLFSGFIAVSLVSRGWWSVFDCGTYWYL